MCKQFTVHWTEGGTMVVDIVRFGSLVTDRLSDTALLFDTTVRRIIGTAESV